MENNISVEEAAKEWADNNQSETTGFNNRYKGFIAGANFILQSPTVQSDAETIRKLNAPLLHFSTLDKMPTLELLGSREDVIAHVVKIAKEYVLPINGVKPVQSDKGEQWVAAESFIKDCLNESRPSLRVIMQGLKLIFNSPPKQ